MLKKLAYAVASESKGLQEPWTEGTIMGDFFFRKVKSEEYLQTASPAIVGQIKPISTVAVDMPTPRPRPPSDENSVAMGVEWAKKSFESMKNGNWIDAIRTASVAISFDPGNFNAYLNRCSAYTARGELSDARMDCDMALKIEPNNPKANNNIGFILEKSGQQDEALKLYLKACFDGSKVACQSFKRYKGYEPNNPDEKQKVKVEEAAKNLRLGFYEMVISMSTELLSEFPRNNEAYINRSAAYSHKGNYDEALADAIAAINLNPNDGRSFNNKGFSLEGKGLLKEAALNYEIACSLNNAVGCDNMARQGRK